MCSFNILVESWITLTVIVFFGDLVVTNKSFIGFGGFVFLSSRDNYQSYILQHFFKVLNLNFVGIKTWSFVWFSPVTDDDSSLPPS